MGDVVVTHEGLPLSATEPKLAVVLLSGGIDSTVLAYKLKSEGWKLHLLTILYGQRLMA